MSQQLRIPVSEEVMIRNIEEGYLNSQSKVAKVGNSQGDEILFSTWFDNTGNDADILVDTKREIININCNSLLGSGADKIEQAGAAAKILSLFVKDLDITSNVNHKNALQFLTTILLATTHNDASTLVFWDDKNNYIVLDFAKIHTDGEEYFELRDIMSTSTQRVSDSEFDLKMIQGYRLSEETLRLLNLTIKDDLVEDDSKEFVVLNVK